MNLRVETPAPLPTPPIKVHLQLSAEEATELRIIVGKISWPPQVIQDLYNALSKGGF